MTSGTRQRRLSSTDQNRWTQGDGQVFQNGLALHVHLDHPNRLQPHGPRKILLAAAVAGQQAVLIEPDRIRDFLLVHANQGMILHDAAPALATLQATVAGTLDLYSNVESGKIWDTAILYRLHRLATQGDSARDDDQLSTCVREHLGRTPVAHQPSTRRSPRLLSHEEIVIQSGPPLTEMARNIWDLFAELKSRIRQFFSQSADAWGHAGHEWLCEMVQSHGPLTHHIQLRAAILVHAMNTVGIRVDRDASARLRAELGNELKSLQEQLRRKGFLVESSGSQATLQRMLARLEKRHPDLHLARTATGQYSTREEDLREAANQDEFWLDYSRYQGLRRLDRCLERLTLDRHHPSFAFLCETGRIACGGGINLQALDRQSGDRERAIRGVFVPREGHVFLDADYRQAELVALAYSLSHQFRYGNTLADLINRGDDLHRRIAAGLLDKPVAEITDEERQSVKAISFGVPGGMGPTSVAATARTNYGVNLTEDQARRGIDAFRSLCPELDPFLYDDLGSVLARRLDLTPAGYHQATGPTPEAESGDQDNPNWLGMMLLKVLGSDQPVTRTGRPYTESEIAYFWRQAQPLADELPPDCQAALRDHRPSMQLRQAVADLASSRTVVTATGRFRAGVRYCASRNTIFQGLAADGAILGLWLVWRAGFTIVNFVHDQVTAEVPLDQNLLERKSQFEQLLRQGMQSVLQGTQSVLHGMNVEVRCVIRRSLHESDVVDDQELERIGRLRK